MMIGSSLTFGISPAGGNRSGKAWFRSKARLEQKCEILRKRSMDQKHPKAHRFRTCPIFHPKDRRRMEQKVPPVDSVTEGTEGRLKELALKWFTDTQAPLILHNGTFPTWFQGFTNRKDAEEMLRGKDQGCFLIRLSDKAIGYILSYKGKDRCRHFVINQSKSGQFIVSGDTEVHDKLLDLIEHYKKSPIEPFGEYLTSSCNEALTEELYDIIQVNPQAKPILGVRDARSTWEQRTDRVLEHPLQVPPKNCRTPEATPPLPKRGIPPKSGPLGDRRTFQNPTLYAHLHQPRETPMVSYNCFDSLVVPGRPNERSTTAIVSHQRETLSRTSPMAGPGPVYSELSTLDCRSKSLPLLDHSTEEQGSHRLNMHSPSPLRLSPQPPRQAAQHTPTRREPLSMPTSSHSLDYLCNSPMYHLAGRPASQISSRYAGPAVGTELDDDNTYAEVPSEPILNCFFLDNTYEQIPEYGLKGTTAMAETNNNNTDKPVEGPKPKHMLSCLGMKNEKWRWFLPEMKRK